MLQNFFLSMLLTNIVYLGYSHQFTNSRMFIDLLGTRKEVDIHNLAHTLFSLKKTLNLFFSCWNKCSTIWVIAIKNPIIKACYSLNKQYIFRNTLYIWTSKWISGLLLNNQITRSWIRQRQYPGCLFYLSYTGNIVRFTEPSKAGLLQSGLADSNSMRFRYNYSINANEKSVVSYLYFLNLLVSHACRLENFKKDEFLLKV